jgi:carbamoylphosphate synthase large subunit
MKKIVLLGGSSQQVIAIKKAKEMGYYTILCDFLDDNPGQYVADKFYLESTTDKEKILEIAKKEQIDGILAYASDPAAPTAAYVSEKLGLSGTPYKSAEILCNKDLFKAFLKDNGFNVPNSKGFNNKKDALFEGKKYDYPIIIKPVDSSGSKGVTVLYNSDNLEKAIDFAFSISRCHRIIIENYIEKKHKYLIGGDIFVIDGKIELWGLMNCHRDNNVNPLVPVGKSYPLDLEEQDINNVKNVLQNIVTNLKIKNCPMNVELVIDKNNKVWPIDIGPRSGGNMIPDLLNLIFDEDVVKMCIQSSMGEQISFSNNKPKMFYATHNLHSNKNGLFKDIVFSDKIEKFIIKKCIYKKEGDRVEFFDNASKALGIIFLKFNNKSEMNDCLSNINDFISIIIE